jgi:hypothetical protein
MIDKSREHLKDWNGRAQKARVHAAQMTDLSSRRMMVEVAEHYEHLARRTEARLSKRDKSNPHLTGTVIAA